LFDVVENNGCSRKEPKTIKAPEVNFVAGGLTHTIGYTPMTFEGFGQTWIPTLLEDTNYLDINIIRIAPYIPIVIYAKV
jgi:hypothetical protein